MRNTIQSAITTGLEAIAQFQRAMAVLADLNAFLWPEDTQFFMGPTGNVITIEAPEGVEDIKQILASQGFKISTVQRAGYGALTGHILTAQRNGEITIMVKIGIKKPTVTNLNTQAVNLMRGPVDDDGID